tara:strand:+ start:1274 stop:1585 length:312 start_codon:yes stop_codon:yes gene_type:complete
MDKKIYSICGDSDQVVDFEAIGNDPNFVFKNDPNFETIVLYDPEGNIVNVNSWLECANYVNGVWTDGLYEQLDFERMLFFLTVSSIFLYLMIKKFRKLKIIND